jgi:hypothetical protein
MAAECHTDTVTWGRARTRRLGVGPAAPGRARLRVGLRTQAAVQL